MLRSLAERRAKEELPERFVDVHFQILLADLVAVYEQIGRLLHGRPCAGDSGISRQQACISIIWGWERRDKPAWRSGWKSRTSKE
jgi:hypothetical protein